MVSWEGTHMDPSAVRNLPQGAGSGIPGSRIRALLRLAGFSALAALHALLPIGAWILTLGNREATARAGGRAFHRLMRAGAPLLGLRVRVEGSPPPPPSVLAPTHVTWLDILVVAWTCEARFVSRADLRGWPFVGRFARLGGTLWIERTRRRDAERVAGEVTDVLRAGARVVVFLEGGVGDGTSLRPFRSSLLEGAVETGVPCAAAAIVYSLPEDPSADVSRDVVWPEDANFLRHALRLLSLRRIDAVVRFGPPRTGTDRKALARQLEEDARQRR